MKIGFCISKKAEPKIKETILTHWFKDDEPVLSKVEEIILEAGSTYSCFEFTSSSLQDILDVTRMLPFEVFAIE